ncbi:hypothetical protein HN587_06430 [Candidatus Woesearchaeota archaeon]|jgi:His-Xaa-Ser system protein HxsD|nr:hypothetical protein [Candidatus Woesearchaeota archaeon]
MISNKLGNITIESDNATFSLNPKIYPIDIVYSAAYIMIDKAFIILDGDPTQEILIEIRKKKPNQDLNLLVQDFNEELLNYSVYKIQNERNKQIRETILQRVLLTNNAEPQTTIKQPKNTVSDTEKIMKPWDAEDYKE